MENVLDVYTKLHDPDIPLVCLDETSKQLVAETRTPIPMKPAQPKARRLRIGARRDRQSVHAVCAPEGWRCAEVRCLAERFEWHHTPKHDSWLNMAESELGVLASQCLNRRIPDKEKLIAEVAAWQGRRNKHQTRAEWRFTTAEARIKLKRLYPRLAALIHFHAPSMTT